MKNFRSMDYFLKFESMKLEWLVIENHHVSVNRKLGVHTLPITGREFFSYKLRQQLNRLNICLNARNVCLRVIGLKL